MISFTRFKYLKFQNLISSVLCFFCTLNANGTVGASNECDQLQFDYATKLVNELPLYDLPKNSNQQLENSNFNFVSFSQSQTCQKLNSRRIVFPILTKLEFINEQQPRPASCQEVEEKLELKKQLSIKIKNLTQKLSQVLPSDSQYSELINEMKLISNESNSLFDYDITLPFIRIHREWSVPDFPDKFDAKGNVLVLINSVFIPNYFDGKLVIDRNPRASGLLQWVGFNRESKKIKIDINLSLVEFCSKAQKLFMENSISYSVPNLQTGSKDLIWSERFLLFGT